MPTVDEHAQRAQDLHSQAFHAMAGATTAHMALVSLIFSRQVAEPGAATTAAEVRDRVGASDRKRVTPLLREAAKLGLLDGGPRKGYTATPVAGQAMALHYKDIPRDWWPLLDSMGVVKPSFRQEQAA